MSHHVLSLEEKINAATHALGGILSLIGMILLFLSPQRSPTGSTIFCIVIFCLSLLSVYASSTFYHLAKTPKQKTSWKRWDHAAIFFLIAGTYTPFCLLIVPGPEASQLLLWVWVLAALGTAGEWVLTGRYRWISTALYLALGWLIVWKWHLVAAMPDRIFPWIVAGGLFYSVGTIFYMWRRLRFHHAIWHLFVIAGSFCHYFAVLTFFN